MLGAKVCHWDLTLKGRTSNVKNNFFLVLFGGGISQSLPNLPRALCTLRFDIMPNTAISNRNLNDLPPPGKRRRLQCEGGTILSVSRQVPTLFSFEKTTKPLRIAMAQSKTTSFATIWSMQLRNRTRGSDPSSLKSGKILQGFKENTMNSNRATHSALTGYSGMNFLLWPHRIAARSSRKRIKSSRIWPPSWRVKSDAFGIKVAAKIVILMEKMDLINRHFI